MFVLFLSWKKDEYRYTKLIPHYVVIAIYNYCSSLYSLLPTGRMIGLAS